MPRMAQLPPTTALPLGVPWSSALRRVARRWTGGVAGVLVQPLLSRAVLFLSCVHPCLQGR